MQYSVGMQHDQGETSGIEHGLGGQLSDAPTDRDLLTFESHAPRSLGAKEDAIKQRLGLTPIRYYQRLNVAIDTPEMMEAFPLLTARLRRKRDERERRRAGR